MLSTISNDNLEKNTIMKAYCNWDGGSWRWLADLLFHLILEKVSFFLFDCQNKKRTRHKTEIPTPTAIPAIKAELMEEEEDAGVGAEVGTITLGMVMVDTFCGKNDKCFRI